MSLKERVSYFVWIDLQGNLHIADNCNEIKSEIEEIRKNYMQEVDKFIDCRKKGLKRPATKFDCLGAFVLTSDDTVDFLTDCYFSSGLQFVYDFLDANKNASCIPVHMNINWDRQAFENITSTVVSIFDGTYKFTPNVDRTFNVKKYAKEFVKFEFLVQGKDYIEEDKLDDFIKSAKGFVSVLAVAHCATGGCTYEVPVLNALVNKENMELFTSEFKKVKAELAS